MTKYYWTRLADVMLMTNQSGYDFDTACAMSRYTPTTIKTIRKAYNQWQAINATDSDIRDYYQGDAIYSDKALEYHLTYVIKTESNTEISINHLASTLRVYDQNQTDYLRRKLRGLQSGELQGKINYKGTHDLDSILIY